MILSYDDFFQISAKLDDFISSEICQSEKLVPELSTLNIVRQKNGDLIVGYTTIKRKEEKIC